MSKRWSGEQRVARDDYPTSVGPLDALLSAVALPRRAQGTDVVFWEPAAGRQHKLARQMRWRGLKVISTSLEDGVDFLKLKKPPVRRRGLAKDKPGVLITNPPFDEAHFFIAHGLFLLRQFTAPRVMAMILPTDYDHAGSEEKGRRHLFADCPDYVGQVKMQRRIVWFERDDGEVARPSEWHSWFVWKLNGRVPGQDAWVRYAGWEGDNGDPNGRSSAGRRRRS
jgi:NADH:ubiquinone oxidoreductase subunit